jgi:predicted nucleic acid-binding Zn ribbon protein
MSDLARELYKSWRNYARKNRAEIGGEDEVREHNEDPLLLGNVLNQLVSSRNWKQGIAEGTLFSEWDQIVGSDLASNAQPISLLDGELTIQTRSTAWATQLTLIAPNLLTTISNSAPGALVERLTIIGPQGPTWKKGLRTIRGGRGPRDTYS